VPAPTAHSAFFAQATATPRPRATEGPTRTPLPTAAVAEQSPAPVATSTRTVVATIYDDTIAPNWTMEHSEEMSSQRVASWVHDGVFALGVTPTNDFGKLFFTVRPDSRVEYPRDRVKQLSFWLNSGDDFLPLDALAVTIVGSNARPYWIEGDKSVTSNVRPIFSETRLYFLDFNENIPPESWVEVNVYLDELIYDPPYEWVTGVYIKNDQGYLKRFFVDNVRLIMVGEE
jgi:hypothetical protein